MQKYNIGLWASAFGLCFACASPAATNGEPRYAQTHEGATPAIGSAPEEAEQQQAGRALPRYFTLRLEGSDALLEGRTLSSRELSQTIRREVDNADIAGAAVYLGKEFSGEMLGAIVWELSSAGFRHIMISDAELEVAPDASALEPVALARPVTATTPTVSPEPAPTPVSSPKATAEPAALGDETLELKPIGLHIGGGPNDDATKARFAEPIERSFDELRRCHALATNRDRKASVGVDLRIGLGGGNPKVEDFRSAIKGDAFRACVVGAFSKVSFPEPPRATVISYSVLFKPNPS